MLELKVDIVLEVVFCEKYVEENLMLPSCPVKRLPTLRCSLNTTKQYQHAPQSQHRESPLHNHQINCILCIIYDDDEQDLSRAPLRMISSARRSESWWECRPAAWRKHICLLWGGDVYNIDGDAISEMIVKE